MFLLAVVKNEDGTIENMLINTDNVYNIVSRSCNNPELPSHEVGVYLDHSHDIVDVKSNKQVFTGSYIVIYRGSEEECQSCFSTFVRHLDVFSVPSY